MMVFLRRSHLLVSLPVFAYTPTVLIFCACLRMSTFVYAYQSPPPLSISVVAMDPVYLFITFFRPCSSVSAP
ncbi:hypothetical protein BJV78DRAFT_1189505 [Lactifluus subvellereus]|nr:hypothetical protein BJV78DRAFT_1189505 [Lactifluus subvellereus]